MEPSIVEQIYQFELLLLQLEVRRSETDLAALIADDFIEYGRKFADGRWQVAFHQGTPTKNESIEYRRTYYGKVGISKH